MGSLSIGSTVGSFPIVHTGMPIVRLSGNLTVNEQLFIGQGVESASDFYGDGNLVVRGSHSSTGKIMQIMNSTGSEAFALYGNGDAYVNRFLGINTNSPGRRLDVNGDGRVRQHMDVGAGSFIDSPGTGSPTLVLGRQSGTPSIEAEDSWLMLESSGSPVGLNYYGSDDILIGNGGGDTQVANGLTVGGTNRSPASRAVIKDSGGARLSLIDPAQGGVGIEYTDSSYKGYHSVDFKVTDANGAAEAGYYANLTDGGHLLLRGQQPSLNIGSSTDNEGLRFTWHDSGRVMLHKSDEHGTTSGGSIFNFYTDGRFEAEELVSTGGGPLAFQLRGDRPGMFFNASNTNQHMRIEANEAGDIRIQAADASGGYEHTVARFDGADRLSDFYSGVNAQGGINIGESQAIADTVNREGAMYYIEGRSDGDGFRCNVLGEWGYMWDHHNLIVSSSEPTGNLHDGMIWIET